MNRYRFLLLAASARNHLLISSLSVMKQHTTMTSHAELVSALVDGQLSSIEYAELLLALEQDSLLLKKWNAYHLVGDALRSSRFVNDSADFSFVERLRQRLSQKDDCVSGRQSLDTRVSVAVVSQSRRVLRPAPGMLTAANDGNYRWKALAGLASIVAVGAIGWNSFVSAFGTGSPQLALSGEVGSEQVVVASPQGPVVRDVRLDEFLAAHRQLGTPSAVQMPSGFLRNAAFDAPQSGTR